MNIPHNKKYKYTYDMRVDTLPTGRTYFTPDGNYSSITTILGKTSNNAWLQAWKDKVGEEEAARISKEATDRGTLVHEYAMQVGAKVLFSNYQTGWIGFN